MIEKLRRAKAKLDARDDEGALGPLLEAWRANRHPRIAAVIDRVSDRLLAATGPVTARTVKLRTAAWLDLAKGKRAVDVGRLVATPWPGTWQDARPVLQSLLAFAHDPRIAMTLARIVEAAPYDTWTSHRFYGPLLDKLGVLRDVRTLAVLEAGVDRRKSYYWEKGTGPHVGATIAKLRALEPPALAKDEEAAIAALEAVFAGAATAEAARGRSEDDLLQAIHADPDDTAARMVYADWLAERGDPRGEFIAVQLAHAQGRGDEASRKRETTLWNKHGKAWLGNLAPVLAKDAIAFERGFLAHAVFAFERRQTELPKVMQDPAWSTVETLELGVRDELDLALARLPVFRMVRAYRNISDLVVDELGPTPRPRVTELAIAVDHGQSAALRKRVAAGAAFPNAKHVGFVASADRSRAELEQLLGGALAKRAERLTLFDRELPIGPWLRLLDKLGLAPAEVAVTEHVEAWREDDWELVMRRDAKRKLTRLTARARDGGRVPPASDLDRALESLRASDLTELVVEGEPCTYDESDIRTLEARLATFGKLGTVAVPWERLGATKRSRAPVKLCLRGTRTWSAAGLGKIWKLAGELGLAFDSIAVNHGAHAQLPADALGHLRELIGKKRTRSLAVYAKSNPDACRLSLSDAYLEITSEVAPGKRFADDYLVWVTRVIDGVGASDGHVWYVAKEDGAYVEQYHELEQVHVFDANQEWLTILGPAVDDTVPFDALETIAERFPWIRTARAKRHLLLAFGDAPDDIPRPESAREFDIAALDVLWRHFEKTRGFSPHAMFDGRLGPLLRERGFARVELDPLATALGRVEYGMRHRAGARLVRFTSTRFRADPGLRLEVTLRCAPKKPSAKFEEHAGRGERETEIGPGYPANEVKTKKQAIALFDDLVARFDDLCAWFDET